jgi:hypothetical protein
MSSYWIMVFNQHALGQFSAASLLTTLKGAHFDRLCDQYGLDRSLIRPTLAHLRVEMAVFEHFPYFLVWYGPNNSPPLVVTAREASMDGRSQLLVDRVDTALPPSVRSMLMKTRFVCGIELLPKQLRDMGLVLAYELARWAAVSGSGIVLALDGSWYRMNTDQAFIPLS